jgi:hypothetical protein
LLISKDLVEGLPDDVFNLRFRKTELHDRNLTPALASLCNRMLPTVDRIDSFLAGRGLAAVSVASDPAQFRGVLPLPISALKSAFPVLGNPANRNRAIPLTYDQFRYAFASVVSEEEAKQLYETYAVPTAGKPIGSRRR